MEQEPVQMNKEDKLDKADLIRHTEMKARAVVEQCLRKNIQPRDLLLKSFEKKERSDELAAKLYETALVLLKNMPDYDLHNQTESVRAKKDIMDIFMPFVDREEGTNDNLNTERMAEWVNVGVFSYEFGPENELILHVPPMKNNPGRHQLMDSLRRLAEILKEDSSIKEVKGSSILLEHPIAKRLGFEIDVKSDDMDSPTFHMSREEFIKRFA